MTKAKVLVCSNMDREVAARSLLEAFHLDDLSGKNVMVKPNFNTSDPAPGSTDIATLRTVLKHVLDQGPGKVMVGDRSGPSDTRTVFEDKGVFTLSRQMGFIPMVFDELPNSEYGRIESRGMHWRNGFLFAKPVIEADVVIGLGCIKTHQYGGHFTMSLKLGTGCVHRHNMAELHAAFIHMRDMIAEINLAYKPRLIILDGVVAFFRGGPMTGGQWNAGLSLASDDRVALDATGVAALKMHGTTKQIEEKGVFEQDQIHRAVVLGLGVSNAQDIELVPVDEPSQDMVDQIGKFLYSGR
jgi:uncharacterized protein (DUF362 family)